MAEKSDSEKDREHIARVIAQYPTWNDRQVANTLPAKGTVRDLVKDMALVDEVRQELDEVNAVRTLKARDQEDRADIAVVFVARLPAFDRRAGGPATAVRELSLARFGRRPSAYRNRPPRTRKPIKGETMTNPSAPHNPIPAPRIPAPDAPRPGVNPGSVPTPRVHPHPDSAPSHIRRSTPRRGAEEVAMAITRDTARIAEHAVRLANEEAARPRRRRGQPAKERPPPRRNPSRSPSSGNGPKTISASQPATSSES